MTNHDILLPNIDDRLIQKLIQQLQEAGYRVQTCSPEPQAFYTAAEKMHPEAVIVDLRTLSGIEAANLLIKLPYKVILLTFHENSYTVAHLKSLGAIAFDGSAVAELPELLQYYIEMTPDP